jgi:hypothetical protein
MDASRLRIAKYAAKIPPGCGARAACRRFQLAPRLFRAQEFPKRCTLRHFDATAMNDGCPQDQLEEQWDKEIERDAKSGRLDHLAHRALADYTAGKTKPLDDIVDGR